MFELTRKNNNCKVFTDNVDKETISQLTALLNQESIAGNNIRIMPDTHAGKGCVIGTTMTLTNHKVIPNLVGVDIGCFTGDTEVWCSGGFYKSIKELAEKNETFMTDAWDEENNIFVIASATAFKTRTDAELVKVTYKKETSFKSQEGETSVRCTPDHKFLTCYENSHKSYYSNDTFIWKEAKDLTCGDRLWAEDSVVVVVNVEKLDEREDVYCLNVPDYHNFSIRHGVIVHNCGMHALKIEGIMDLPKLDSVIREYVPSGFCIHEKPLREDTNLHEIVAPVNMDHAYKSLGTLGGGNHFIEANIDSKGNYWLVIHSGSRHLGIEICDYYQQLAYDKLKEKLNGGDIKTLNKQLVEELTKQGRQKEISKELKKLRDKIKSSTPNIPKELAYLEGEDFDNYIHDMRIAQNHARINRIIMAEQIVKHMKWHIIDEFVTIHNYIDTDSNILRKGAVSAKENERLIIPMNMRDGSLICRGKGNSDWNYSAPHGAGRLMSRSAAKDTISMEEYKKSMNGIYTTSVNTSTIDEAPMAYKPIEEIINNIKDTAEIVDIIKPIYNFKASE